MRLVSSWKIGIKPRRCQKFSKRGYGLRGGLRGGAQSNSVRAAGLRGKVPGFSGDGYAFLSAISTGGQVGNRQPRRGRGEDRARRSHAVEKPKDLELRFELVGHAVDGQIGLAHGAFDGGDVR